MAKMVCTVVPQEPDDEQHKSVTQGECESSTAVRQDDVQGFQGIHVKMGHEITLLVTGLQKATEGFKFP